MNEAMKRAAANYGLEHVETVEELFECLMEIFGDENEVDRYLSGYTLMMRVLRS